MKESENRAKRLLEELGFQQVTPAKGDAGSADLTGTLNGNECVVEVKSVTKEGITKYNDRSTATLKRHQMWRMGEDKLKRNVRPFVLYLDGEGRYFLFELTKARIDKA